MICFARRRHNSIHRDGCWAAQRRRGGSTEASGARSPCGAAHPLPGARWRAGGEAAVTVSSSCDGRVVVVRGRDRRDGVTGGRLTRASGTFPPLPPPAAAWTIKRAQPPVAAALLPAVVVACVQLRKLQAMSAAIIARIAVLAATGVLVLLLLAAPASSHICVFAPHQRGALDVSQAGDHDCYRKTQPCGDNTPGPIAASLQPRQLYTVRWQQNFNHYEPGWPGWMDISFACNDSGSISSADQFTQLRVVPDFYAHFQATQTNYSMEVELPDTTCSVRRVCCACGRGLCVLTQRSCSTACCGRDTRRTSRQRTSSYSAPTLPSTRNQTTQCTSTASRRQRSTSVREAVCAGGRCDAKAERTAAVFVQVDVSSGVVLAVAPQDVVVRVVDSQQTVQSNAPFAVDDVVGVSPHGFFYPVSSSLTERGRDRFHCEREDAISRETS